MAVLFVLGAMSLFWMAVVAVAIFAEKVLPHGTRLAPVFAVALVALGIWVCGVAGKRSQADRAGRRDALDGDGLMKVGMRK